MSALVEFLRARLDEDAAEIAKQPDGRGEPGGIGIWSSGDAISNTEYLILSKRRALAEIDAKRQVIAMYEDAVAFIEMMKAHGKTAPAHEAAAESYLNVIRAHIAAYADHPDYRNGWQRP